MTSNGQNYSRMDRSIVRLRRRSIRSVLGEQDELELRWAKLEMIAREVNGVEMSRTTLLRILPTSTYHTEM